MGLDAVVRCRCWEEGKVSSPPVPLSEIEIDDEGWLSLVLPWKGNEEKHTRFDEWLETCCSHPRTDFACEHISNWGGYRIFQQRLEELGWERFPTLKTELPEANGGMTGAVAAAAALKELATFKELASSLSRAVLVESSSGEVVHEFVAAYGGAFILSGRTGLEVGVGEWSFFVRQMDTEIPLFSSSDFNQILLDPEEAERPRVRFVDRATGESYECSVAVGIHEDEVVDGVTRVARYPSHMHVERRPLAVDDYSYITGSLETVFWASVATGNPVLWT